LGKAGSLISNFDHLYLLIHCLEVLNCLYLEILVLFSFVCILALQNLLEIFFLVLYRKHKYEQQKKKRVQQKRSVGKFGQLIHLPPKYVFTMLIYVASFLVSTLYSKTHGLERAENGVLTMSIFTYQVTWLTSLCFKANNQLRVTNHYAYSVLQNRTILMNLVRTGHNGIKRMLYTGWNCSKLFRVMEWQKLLDKICLRHDMT
jgi:hypothetical protein